MENEKGFQPSRLKALNLVGTPRFELGASPTPRVRATRLRHVPLLQSYYPAKAQLSNRAGERVATLQSLGAILILFLKQA